MQKIHTKNYGTIEFIKTWVDSHIHIGITSDGQYRHIGGPVVKNRADLAIITDENDRREAEAWFVETYERPQNPSQLQQESDSVAHGVAETIAEANIAAIKEGLESIEDTLKKRYKCSSCGEVFSSPVLLARHVKTHKAKTQ